MKSENIDSKKASGNGNISSNTLKLNLQFFASYVLMSITHVIRTNKRN